MEKETKEIQSEGKNACSAVIQLEDSTYEIHVVVPTRYTKIEHLKELQDRILDSAMQVEKSYWPKVDKKLLKAIPNN